MTFSGQGGSATMAAGRAFRRRRVLVLTPRNPYPVTGGDRVRIHRIARELARHHELTLLTLCKSERERREAPPDDGIFANVQRIVLPSWRSWLNALAALPTRDPLQVAYYRCPEFRAAAEWLAPSHDVVLAHLVRTAEYARDLPCVRLLEMTDAISMSMQRTASQAACFDPRRLVYAVEGWRMPEYERRMARAFDSVTLTSAVDYDFLFDVTSDRHDRIMIVPNGADSPPAQPPAQHSRNIDEIVFVGNLHSLQNFDAAWYFAKHALPLIRARRPRATLKIIGDARPWAARRLSALPGVHVAGVVKDLTHALATARVGICPMRAGAGVKNKVLDYLANGLATICSPVGLEGLSARPGTHVLLADTPAEWAECVERLLADEALAQTLADAGRALVEREYRWDQRMLPLLSRLDELCERAAVTAREDRASAGVSPVDIVSLARTGS